MAKRGAPPGNNNAGKNRRWAKAIEWVLDNHKFSSVKKTTALRALAIKLVEKGLEGDHQAITEIGNRLDGKPHQSLDVGHFDVPLEELGDAELLGVIDRCRSIIEQGGGRTAETKAGKEKPSSVH